MGFFLCVISLNLQASERSTYCKLSRSPLYFKAQAYLPENHLSVKNYGGLFNEGVCWWHSLFQRAALYLAVFDSSKPKPTPAQIENIIHKLAAGGQVVVIPGYKNIQEFSLANWLVIQAKLEEWQMVDGFLKQEWIKSITATNTTDPKILEKTMVDIYRDVQEREQIEWVMLKVKGIGAHAWLVVDIAKVQDGYEMLVIDSNFPQVMANVVYQKGMDSFKSYLGPIVPYPGRKHFFTDFKKAQENFCDGRPYLDDAVTLNNNFN